MINEFILTISIILGLVLWTIGAGLTARVSGGFDEEFELFVFIFWIILFIVFSIIALYKWARGKK